MRKSFIVAFVVSFVASFFGTSYIIGKRMR